MLARHQVAKLTQIVRHRLTRRHGSMPATGTSATNGQIRFAFLLIQRNERGLELLQVRQKFSADRIGEGILSHARLLSGGGSQLGHKMWIG